MWTIFDGKRYYNCFQNQFLFEENLSIPKEVPQSLDFAPIVWNFSTISIFRECSRSFFVCALIAFFVAGIFLNFTMLTVEGYVESKSEKVTVICFRLFSKE